MVRDELKPSLEMWRYYQGVITIDAVLSAIADKIGGYHISYSAMELLKDLNLVTKAGNVNKKARQVLAHDLHEQFHRGVRGVILIPPEEQKNG